MDVTRKAGLEEGAEPLDGIIVGELPSDVFARRFGNYFFSDIDLNSSESIIAALRQVAVVCSGLDSEVDVFASSSRRLLATLDNEANWPREIKKLGREMWVDGDAGGMFIIDRRKKWVIYQARPVDLAVLAFDYHADLRGISRSRQLLHDRRRQELALASNRSRQGVGRRLRKGLSFRVGRELFMSQAASG